MTAISHMMESKQTPPVLPADTNCKLLDIPIYSTRNPPDFYNYLSSSTANFQIKYLMKQIHLVKRNTLVLLYNTLQTMYQ